MVYLNPFSCQFLGSFVCGSISFPCSECGVGLHLRGNALGRSGSDDYVSGGDVAIGLIPDLLSRGTATVWFPPLTVCGGGFFINVVLNGSAYDS